MRDDIDFPGEDPLDRLLGGAEWPEPDPLRLARLQHALDRALARRQQRRRRIRVALAAAAVFSIAARSIVTTGLDVSMSTRRMFEPVTVIVSSCWLDSSCASTGAADKPTTAVVPAYNA